MDSKYLNDAKLIQNASIGCGLGGFVILDGLLQKWKNTVLRSKPIRNELIVEPTHPSYYGMVIASFLPT